MAVTLTENQSAGNIKRKVVFTSAPCHQEASLFFQKLPQEIRDLVYFHYFHSTRLSHGDIPFSWSRRIKVKTAPNALALLRACRRVRAEVGASWLGQVLFNFEDCGTMLDKLTALPAATLSRIRHLRVRGDTLMPSLPGYSPHYRLASALKLLPGLQLDTLTVLRGTSDAISYDTLSALIAESGGWKELRYISHTSTLLGFANPPTDIWSSTTPPNDYVRKPQPEGWRSALLDRDGECSNPTVSIYRSTKDREVGSVLHQENRVQFEQKPTGADRDFFGAEEDASLCEEGESYKELLIVARRGEGIDYRETAGSPFITRDIRQDVPGMTWQEIKENYIDKPRESEDIDHSKGEFAAEFKAQLPEVDQYHDVDEYIWTLFHFGMEHLW